MAHKSKIGGTTYEIGGGKVLVGGTGYSIDKGRTLVGGTGYDISFGTPIGSLAVGTSVRFNYEGSAEEFIVVHQGNPDSTIYDASCDGTWLLQKNVYFTDSWDYNSNDYKSSRVHERLNSEILGFLDSNIQSAVKQVEIPYWNGTGDGGSLATGSKGLSTKIFLLSAYEVGYDTQNSDYIPSNEGSCLDYFKGALRQESPIRIAYKGGTAAQWWLRSPRTGTSYYVWLIGITGGMAYNSRTVMIGYRPAFILPSDFDVTNYLA